MTKVTLDEWADKKFKVAFSTDMINKLLFEECDMYMIGKIPVDEDCVTVDRHIASSDIGTISWIQIEQFRDRNIDVVFELRLHIKGIGHLFACRHVIGSSVVGYKTAKAETLKCFEKACDFLGIKYKHTYEFITEGEKWMIKKL